MIRVEGETGPGAVEGGPVGVADLGEQVGGERVEDDVDEVVAGGELQGLRRDEAPGFRRLARGRPGLGGRERRQRQDRSLQRHQHPARGGREPG